MRDTEPAQENGTGGRPLPVVADGDGAGAAGLPRRPTPRPRPDAPVPDDPAVGGSSGASTGTADDPADDPADTEQRRTGLLDDIVGSQAPADPAPARRGGVRNRVLLVLGVLVLAGLIAGFVARTYEIPSESMESTLHGCRTCDNDQVLVDRLVFRFVDPRPGDVVVFTAGPEIWKNNEVSNMGETNPIVRGVESLLSGVGVSSGADTSFVKRVIAVGGQTVSCCDARNRVEVDGTGIDEPYLYFAPAAGAAKQQTFAPYTVPQGHYFVMGDNRNRSIDSRAAGNGAVPRSSFVGKVRLIVLPVGRMGPVA